VTIELLDDAELDLKEAIAFYEAQSPGLGDYFSDSVFADLESLHIHAGVHALHYGYHRLLAKRFPFAIYYRSRGDVIRIHAILDCRRSPTWIRGRLE